MSKNKPINILEFDKVIMTLNTLPKHLRLIV
jgi:hypothetical protein